MPFSPDRINRLVVRDTLQTTRDDNFFAIGDCACYVLPGEGKPTPPRAQTAHQMASLMAKVDARASQKQVRWYAVCMERAVAYLRVSTQRQQRSGLGIEAQRKAIQQFATSESLKLVAEFVEFESGKGADALDRRPELAAALAAEKERRLISEQGCIIGQEDKWDKAWQSAQP